MKRTIIYSLMLQIKFFIVEFLNISYQLVPNPIRNLYLRLFGIHISQYSYIHRQCKFFHIGKIIIGEHSVINFGCYLDNRRGIKIGNNTAIAHGTKIYTLGHNINSPSFETIGKSVIIGDNVFIFSNVLIMPGVNIGNGAIVLSGSVVTKDIPPFTIVGGNPAKKIKERQVEISYKNNYGYWFAL